MSPPEAAAGPPRDRARLLESVGDQRARIYSMVRTILDDLEAVAPWEGLYYPPTETAAFLSMETALIGMIEDIPQRATALARELEGEPLDDAGRAMVDTMGFYFHNIQVSVAAELDKLKAKLEALKARDNAPSAEERNYTCEISADLKGKYTSSIMGAAAGLIAEGLWNGVEIEPVLFPEKAEEFDRNEKLVEALSEVTEDIGNFLELVPLVDLVASWKAGRRVDQYALAPLYTLLGNLGKLMQVTSRRALYSGDYHQIQRRESLLNTRINELATLHNATWGAVSEAQSAEATELYPRMVRKATEMAAVLDLGILKKIVGESAVKDLFAVVTMEREDAAAGREVGEERRFARRRRIPLELHSLVPLLYDEDLKTFLELLLGSMLKRASLTVQRQSPPQPAPEDEATAEVLPPVDLPPVDLPAAQEAAAPEPPEPLVDGAPLTATASAAAGEAASELGQLAALEGVLEALRPLLSRSSSQRKSFELVRRLLKQRRAIPTGLLESMRPYLYEVMNQLIPRLRDEPLLGDMFARFGSGLFDHCQVLCAPDLAPDSLEVEVPAVMEKVLDLLNRLAIATRSSIERLSGEPETLTRIEVLRRPERA